MHFQTRADEEFIKCCMTPSMATRSLQVSSALGVRRFVRTGPLRERAAPSSFFYIGPRQVQPKTVPLRL